ncbi:MAG: UDP-N-acetylmuramoyl-tripeptide--D-alanyl-D-alanine ligase [Bacillota bacterium]|nr:UDP-N-acetylmuramoyl-tripeptide--D-alanyl-D-alanine ligase [Bacillota bacterium]
MIYGLMIGIIMWGFNLFFRLKYYLHMMQLEMYDNEKYQNWISSNKNKTRTKKTGYLVALTAFITTIYIIYPYNIFIYIGIWVAGNIYSLEYTKVENKKPLVFTKRAKRLFLGTIAAAVIDLLLVILVVKLIVGSSYYIPISIFILSLSIYFSSYYLIIGNWIVTPVEKSINLKFYKKAYDKVRNIEDLTTIGITGSYGKTSTKFITSKILAQKYKTTNTPDSYNTPMGISKFINQELSEEYRVFVAELGAEKLGEIKEVAKLVNPKIGIITSIGPSHLKTFKSIDNIMKTKYELIKELPADGTAIFNYDNEHVRKLADKTYRNKILYGIESKKDVDIYAEDIQTTPKGSTFTLHIKEKGTVQCRTKLLGKHNILNILAGVAAAYAMDMTLVQISSGIERIEPVEHRLQLIDPGTGVYVIDDAFNSNPKGAEAALEVLRDFTKGNKIIVTPGMVELGKLQDDENFKFGEKIAQVCDTVILVGKSQTQPIYDGLESKNYDTSKIHVVKNLEEAQDLIGKIVKVNDVVLFENDLPDTYSE